MMYEATESIILEDKLGKAYQFLKGHEYCIDTKSTDDKIIAKGLNCIRYIPRNCYFLTSEQVNKYFNPVTYTYVYGGRGHQKLF